MFGHEALAAVALRGDRGIIGDVMPLFLSDTTNKVLTLAAVWIAIGVLMLAWGLLGRTRWPRQASVAIAAGIGVIVVGAVGAMMASVM